MLEIKNLKTHFFVDNEIIKAVNGVSLEIKENTTLGLVGESGCGKSILAMSLIKIFQSPPGKIVNGNINYFESKNSIDIVNLNINSKELRRLRNNEIGFRMLSLLHRGWSVCVWPNTKGKDINEMILNGQTIDKILNNINMNTYSGQRGEWEVRMWKV